MLNLTDIKFEDIDFYYTSYGTRKGIYKNKYLVCVYRFAVEAYELNKEVAQWIIEPWRVPKNLFWYHHNDYRNRKISIDPCDIYCSITGKPHVEMDICLSNEKYELNNKNLKREIIEVARHYTLELIIDGDN